MNIYFKTLLMTALASFCAVSTAQETCSVGMTEFASTPQAFDSILINPTCSSGNMFTTSQLAWTIEPTKGSKATIYSYPDNAVTATVDENVLMFDLNDMGEVPDFAGVVIQVPESQLLDVTVDGIMNYVRITRGHLNLMSVNSLGMNSVVEADLSESPYSSITVDTTNSFHHITGDYLNLSIFSVSSKIHISGSVLGGGFNGFSNQLSVDGEVRDLWIQGNQNTLEAADCESVVVDSVSSSCTILDETPTDFPSVPCTFPGCEKTCMSTSFGTCSCTEAECDHPDHDEYVDNIKGASGAASIGVWTIAMVSATFAMVTAI